MTQEEFVQVLKKGGYSFERVGDEILVTHQGSVWLDSLKSLPPGVRFENQGHVGLDSFESLPSGVRFENQGDVWLDTLESLPPGVQFQNRGNVWLNSLESLPPGFRFENQGSVNLSSLVGGWFEEWAGNIEGVDPKRLLNLMIKREIFDK
jgi:hypothetical protein